MAQVHQDNRQEGLPSFGKTNQTKDYMWLHYCETNLDEDRYYP